MILLDIFKSWRSDFQVVAINKIKRHRAIITTDHLGEYLNQNGTNLELHTLNCIPVQTHIHGASHIVPVPNTTKNVNK